MNWTKRWSALGLGLLLLALARGLGAAELPYTSDDYLVCPYGDETGKEHQPGRASRRAICQAEHSVKRGSAADKLVNEAAQLAGQTYGGYVRLVRNLPRGSAVQQRVIAEQKAFLEERDRCGQDIRCMVRVEKARLEVLLDLRRQTEVAFPFDAMERMTQGWKTAQGRSLKDRLLQGLAIYPLRSAALDEKTQLQWGFMPHAATVQTLGVLNPQAKEAKRILALVTADGLYRAGRLDASVRTEAENLRIYVPHRADLAVVLPAITSWALADRLGFNIDCAKDAELCRAAQEGSPPFAVEAYDLSCKQKADVPACRLPLPPLRPSLPLDSFWQ